MEADTYGGLKWKKISLIHMDMTDDLQRVDEVMTNILDIALLSFGINIVLDKTKKPSDLQVEPVLL